jgi:hypothetical protein
LWLLAAVVEQVLEAAAGQVVCCQALHWSLTHIQPML